MLFFHSRFPANKIFLLSLSLLFGMFIESCAYNPRSYEIEKPIKVAVFDFESAQRNPQSGTIFTEIFMEALTEITNGKYIPLERSKISFIFEEYKLQHSGLVDESQYKKIGKLSGADAIIIGKVTLWKKGSFTTQAAVGYTARCIEVETGRVLWYSSYSDTIWEMAMEQRTPEIIAKTAALRGLDKIHSKLFSSR